MAVGDFTIIRRSLRARLFSTVTTVLTVAVAVALMLVLLSMRDAGKAAFARGSGNMHLLISRDQSPMVAVLNGVFYANAPRNSISWSEFEAISQREPWAWTIPVQQGDNYKGLPVLATTEEFFALFEPHAGEGWALAEGRFFEGPWEVVVGASAAARAWLGVGDTIYLTHGTGAQGHEHREYAFEVVGVLEPTGSAHDNALFIDITSSWVLHAHDRRVAELGPGIELTGVGDLIPEDLQITGIYARVITREGRDATAALQGVFDRLRRDTSITVASPVNQVERLFAIVSNVDEIFLGMAAVVMVSSGIAIMLALYNSMEQRRRQIAVLRVLGCSRGRVFGLVLTESALLGLFGALAGAGLALVGVLATARVMHARLGLAIEPTISSDWAVVVLVATVGLASAAGVVPAMVGYRTEVARHLRPVA